MSDSPGAEEEEGDSRQSLVVSLRYRTSRIPPSSQDMRNGSAIYEDHSFPSIMTSNSEGSPETAYSTDALAKSWNGAPKSTQDAALTQSWRSTQRPPPLHHAILTENAASTHHTAPTDPQPRVKDSSQGMPIAAGKDHTTLHPNFSDHRNTRRQEPHGQAQKQVS